MYIRKTDEVAKRPKQDSRQLSKSLTAVNLKSVNDNTRLSR